MIDQKERIRLTLKNRNRAYKIWVKVFDNNSHVETLTFDMGHTWEINSFNRFFHGCGKSRKHLTVKGLHEGRWPFAGPSNCLSCSRTTDKIWYHQKDEQEWQSEINVLKGVIEKCGGSLPPQLPVSNHFQTIWHFYDHIGWDHKKKKWTK